MGYHLKKAGECVGEGVEQLQHEEEAVVESEAHVGRRLLLALDLDLASAGKPVKTKKIYCNTETSFTLTIPYQIKTFANKNGSV